LAVEDVGETFVWKKTKCGRIAAIIAVGALLLMQLLFRVCSNVKTNSGLNKIL